MFRFRCFPDVPLRTVSPPNSITNFEVKYRRERRVCCEHRPKSNDALLFLWKVWSRPCEEFPIIILPTTSLCDRGATECIKISYGMRFDRNATADRNNVAGEILSFSSPAYSQTTTGSLRKRLVS